MPSKLKINFIKYMVEIANEKNYGLEILKNDTEFSQNEYFKDSSLYNEAQ